MKAKSEVFNMDCIEGMKQYPDKYFELAIVDPPYGINADIQQNKLGGNKGFNKKSGKYKKYHNTNWDDEIPNELYFNELFRVSKNQIIWGGNYFFDIDLTGVIIWYKGNSGNFKEGEMAKSSFNTFKIYSMSRADAYINNGDLKIHPTQKPKELYKWLLTNYAKKGDKILDTHLGSGSSRIAAYDLGFDFIGFELDEDYFKASEKRFKQHTDQLTLF